MENVFFKPWIGKNYATTGLNGKKVLVLGESHICGGCDKCGDLNNEDNICRNFTSLATLKPYLEYKDNNREHAGWMNTFTRFGNIFNNKHLNNEEVNDFWNSVIFYNFVQYSTSESRSSPTEEEFNKSHKAFFEILSEYKPDIVYAWGDRLFQHMPRNGKWGDSPIAADGQEYGFLYYYNIEGKEIPILGLYHPSSSRFNYSQHPFIKEALENI